MVADEAGPTTPAFEAYGRLAIGQATYTWSTNIK